MAGKLKVTQIKSTISHIARNRATIKALGLHGIGSTSIVADNAATRGMVRQVRFLVTVEEIAEESAGKRSAGAAGEGMKLHDLRPAEGSRTRQDPRRSRHRGRQGQDRGPRHEGPEGACRWLHPGLVRGWPDAAPHAHPQAARLQEPIQDPVRGRERRGDPGRRGPRCARARGAGRQGQGEGRDPDHGQPGPAAGRRSRAQPEQAAQDPRQRRPQRGAVRGG